MPFDVADPAFAERIKDSFNHQQIMQLFAARLETIEPGQVEIALPFRETLCQQHGFLHAGVVTTLVDNACGYAALSLMPADSGVLTVEFKVNFLAPAQGEYFLARGWVSKAGRTLSVCHGEVIAVSGSTRKPVAEMMATMMCLRDRGLQG